MDWKHLLAYITGTVDQELLLRNEYLVTENRILRHQLKGRVRLSDGERKALAEIGQKLANRRCRKWPGSSNPKRSRLAPQARRTEVRWLQAAQGARAPPHRPRAGGLGGAHGPGESPLGL